jgi:acyl carrier protein
MMQRIQSAFVKVFGHQPPFDPHLSRVNDARWTSLRHVELILALESEFNVRFDGADATDMSSITGVAERLTRKLT